MTVIIIEALWLGGRRFRGVETHPTFAPPHHLGHAERARKHPPSSGPKNAPGARTLHAKARHWPPDATRGCGEGSEGSLPWEDQASEIVVKPTKILNSAGAVSRPGWRR